MSTLLVTISTLFAGVALAVSILGYLARNRPYVGVESLSLSRHVGEDTRKLRIEVENVGDIPAIDVIVHVADSAGEIQEEQSSIPLGVLFPHQIVSFELTVPFSIAYSPDKELSHREDLEDGQSRYIPVYPEGDAVIVTCLITYTQPLAFGVKLWKYKTIQPLRLADDGTWQPSLTKFATMS